MGEGGGAACGPRRALSQDQKPDFAGRHHEIGGGKKKKRWKESRGAFMEAAKAPRAEKSHGGVNATHETSAF